MLERTILRTSLRSLQRQTSRTQLASTSIRSARTPIVTRLPIHQSTTRSFTTTIRQRIDVTEDADKNTTKQSQAHNRPTEPTPLSDEQYHETTDAYFETILNKLEEKQEEKGDMDVEYSQGVMNIIFPPIGTYVLNKQPPNKQIWLSSPMSGPKRFDWVVSGEGMHEKSGSGGGDWIYLRDGTSLTEILRKELGVEVGGGDDMVGEV